MSAVTRFAGVDLDAGVAIYDVIKTRYNTQLIVTRLISHYVITRYATVVTAIYRSYYLPDGNLYTVIRIPTRIRLSEKAQTVLKGVTTKVETKTSTASQGQGGAAEKVGNTVKLVAI